MAIIDIQHEGFTCYQVENIAVLKISKGTKKFFTSVGGKESLISTLQTIGGLKTIEGVAVIYSDNYAGSDEYRQLLSELLEKETISVKHFSNPFRLAISQLLNVIYSYPLPIICGMNGRIGPDSLGLSLACDFRIATDRTIFFHDNLQLGLSPSAILSYYLVQGLGSSSAIELLFTKTEFKPKELYDLRLISKIVSAEELESSCLQQLGALTQIPRQVLVNARRVLQPNIDDVLKHIDACFESSLRNMYETKT
ncbi:MAG: enoyl-CoA hydratase/isomerase family protein [Desulfobacterales bacterium]